MQWDIVIIVTIFITKFRCPLWGICKDDAIVSADNPSASLTFSSTSRRFAVLAIITTRYSISMVISSFENCDFFPTRSSLQHDSLQLCTMRSILRQSLVIVMMTMMPTMLTVICLCSTPQQPVSICGVHFGSDQNPSVCSLYRSNNIYPSQLFRSLYPANRVTYRTVFLLVQFLLIGQIRRHPSSDWMCKQRI